MLVEIARDHLVSCAGRQIDQKPGVAASCPRQPGKPRLGSVDGGHRPDQLDGCCVVQFGEADCDGLLIFFLKETGHHVVRPEFLLAVGREKREIAVVPTPSQEFEDRNGRVVRPLERIHEEDRLARFGDGGEEAQKTLAHVPGHARPS